MTRLLKLAACAGLALAAVTAEAAAGAWTMPIKTRTLDNGLTVVVSEDHTSPTVGVSVVYRIGMRREPQGPTGFAHLFEHMMFQGTPTAPKGVFDQVIQGGGGVLNGSTHADYTIYIEAAPVSALEPILWLEADRMKTLDFSPKNLRNQQDVVKEEIRGNVKNQPYGLFFSTDIARLAFTKWENAHDGYGSFADLDGASLQDGLASAGSTVRPAATASTGRPARPAQTGKTARPANAGRRGSTGPPAGTGKTERTAATGGTEKTALPGETRRTSSR